MPAAVTRATPFRTFSGSVAVLVLTLAGCTALGVEEATPEVTVEKRMALYVDPIEEYVDARLSVMSLPEKIASLFMLHLAGTDAAALGAFARDTGIGGLILMGDNIPEPESALASMTPVLSAEPGLPILVAIDQEGGVVRRLFEDRWDSASDLRYLPPQSAKAAFASRGRMLKALGVSVNFGIVADVTGESSSFIFDRSMGSTGVEAAPRVHEAVAGERGLVESTLKHFPGHGVAPGDSHSSVPATTIGYDEWLAGHAPPFQAGIDAGARFVMLGHLQFDSIDAWPATLSPVWNGILRDELGFDGITITDDMLMLERSGRDELADTSGNAIRALAAGATMLLYVGGIDVAQVVADVGAAVAAGTITEAAIDDATRRLLLLRRALSGQTGPFVHCFDACQEMIE
jgi:beta-N-acetylhexosaminidase